jgi:Domain of unknown function (DUF4395)
MNTHIECPVDKITINETQARITAFFVLCACGWILFYPSWPVAAFLVIDFMFRMLGWAKYSLLNRIGAWVVKRLSLPVKPVDRAPKRFAAGIGLFFCAAILVCITVGYQKTAFSLTLIIAIFAALESFAGFCAGCYAYTLLKEIQKMITGTETTNRGHLRKPEKSINIVGN